MDHTLRDFRRGHAQDLAESGATLRTILEAGEWKSPAFAVYLDMAVSESRASLEAHAVDSSEDEE